MPPKGLRDAASKRSLSSRLFHPMLAGATLRDRLLATIAREGEDIDWSGIARTVAANAAA